MYNWNSGLENTVTPEIILMNYRSKNKYSAFDILWMMSCKLHSTKYNYYLSLNTHYIDTAMQKWQNKCIHPFIGHPIGNMRDAFQFFTSNASRPHRLTHCRHWHCLGCLNSAAKELSKYLFSYKLDRIYRNIRGDCSYRFLQPLTFYNNIGPI